MVEDMVEDIKELILILDKLIQLMVVVTMVNLDLVVLLQHHQVHRPINKKSHSFKKFLPFKMLVLLMLVEYNGDKILRNQNNKKLHLTKQLIHLQANLQKKIKMQQCLHNLQLVKKEWTKIVMMMHQLLLNRNNQKLHQWIYLIWDLLILSQHLMDLVIY